MTAAILSALAFGLALFALTQRRLLWGVLGVGAHSLTLAGLYLALSAPDVALTEAAVGFGLVTLTYLLALRRTGKLVVAACPLYPLLYQEGERITGLEWEILERFARWCHRDLEIVWVPRREIPRLLHAGEAHLGAGGFLPGPEERVRFSRPLVPTKLVCLRLHEGPLGAVAGEPGQELATIAYEDAGELARALLRGEIGGAVVDLLRQREWQLHRLISHEGSTATLEEKGFAFAVAPDEEELWKSLEEFLAALEKAGVLEELRRRYLG
jgi:uncharacterized MnhB-related membrane protein